MSAPVPLVTLIVLDGWGLAPPGPGNVVELEHGFKHTACMHSKNLDALHRMAVAINCSIFVKNGSNLAGLGFGGEGPTAMTISTPTGEGPTDASAVGAHLG